MDISLNSVLQNTRQYFQGIPSGRHPEISGYPHSPPSHQLTNAIPRHYSVAVTYPPVREESPPSRSSCNGNSQHSVIRTESFPNGYFSHQFSDPKYQYTVCSSRAAADYMSVYNNSGSLNQNQQQQPTMFSMEREQAVVRSDGEQRVSAFSPPRSASGHIAPYIPQTRMLRPEPMEISSPSHFQRQPSYHHVLASQPRLQMYESSPRSEEHIIQRVEPCYPVEVAAPLKREAPLDLSVKTIRQSVADSTLQHHLLMQKQREDYPGRHSHLPRSIPFNGVVPTIAMPNNNCGQYHTTHSNPCPHNSHSETESSVLSTLPRRLQASVHAERDVQYVRYEYKQRQEISVSYVAPGPAPSYYAGARRGDESSGEEWKVTQRVESVVNAAPSTVNLVKDRNPEWRVKIERVIDDKLLKATEERIARENNLITNGCEEVNSNGSVDGKTPRKIIIDILRTNLVKKDKERHDGSEEEDDGETSLNEQQQQQQQPSHHPELNLSSKLRHNPTSHRNVLDNRENHLHQHLYQTQYVHEEDDRRKEQFAKLHQLQHHRSISPIIQNNGPIVTSEHVLRPAVIVEKPRIKLDQYSYHHQQQQKNQWRDFHEQQMRHLHQNQTLHQKPLQLPAFHALLPSKPAPPISHQPAYYIKDDYMKICAGEIRKSQVMTFKGAEESQSNPSPPKFMTKAQMKQVSIPVTPETHHHRSSQPKNKAEAFSNAQRAFSAILSNRDSVLLKELKNEGDSTLHVVKVEPNGDVKPRRRLFSRNEDGSNGASCVARSSSETSVFDFREDSDSDSVSAEVQSLSDMRRDRKLKTPTSSSECNKEDFLDIDWIEVCDNLVDQLAFGTEPKKKGRKRVAEKEVTVKIEEHGGKKIKVEEDVMVETFEKSEDEQKEGEVVRLKTSPLLGTRMMDQKTADLVSQYLYEDAYVSEEEEEEEEEDDDSDEDFVCSVKSEGKPQRRVRRKNQVDTYEEDEENDDDDDDDTDNSDEKESSSSTISTSEGEEERASTSKKCALEKARQMKLKRRNIMTRKRKAEMEMARKGKGRVLRNVNSKVAVVGKKAGIFGCKSKRQTRNAKMEMKENVKKKGKKVVPVVEKTGKTGLDKKLAVKKEIVKKVSMGGDKVCKDKKENNKKKCREKVVEVEDPCRINLRSRKVILKEQKVRKYVKKIKRKEEIEAKDKKREVKSNSEFREDESKLIENEINRNEPWEEELYFNYSLHTPLKLISMTKPGDWCGVNCSSLPDLGCKNDNQEAEEGWKLRCFQELHRLKSVEESSGRTGVIRHGRRRSSRESSIMGAAGVHQHQWKQHSKEELWERPFSAPPADINSLYPEDLHPHVQLWIHVIKGESLHKAKNHMLEGSGHGELRPNNLEEYLEQEESVGGTSGSRRRRRRRTKCTSGFDYLKKKRQQQLLLPQLSTSVDGEEHKKQVAPVRNSVEDIQNEIKTWALNKGIGETVLHRAARYNCLDIASYCLEKWEGVASSADNAGYTPLHEACARGHVEIAKMLLKYGADVSASAKGGIRPLHDAIECGNVEVIRSLLSYGADPLLATYAGQTPLDLIKDERNDLREFLLDYIADVQGKEAKPWPFSACNDPKSISKMGADVLDGVDECDYMEAEVEIECCEHPMPECYSGEEEDGKQLWVLHSDLSTKVREIFKNAGEQRIENVPEVKKVGKAEFEEKYRSTTFWEYTHLPALRPKPKGYSLVRYDETLKKILGIDTVKIY